MLAHLWRYDRCTLKCAGVCLRATNHIAEMWSRVFAPSQMASPKQPPNTAKACGSGVENMHPALMSLDRTAPVKHCLNSPSQSKTAIDVNVISVNVHQKVTNVGFISPPPTAQAPRRTKTISAQLTRCSGRSSNQSSSLSCGSSWHCCAATKTIPMATPLRTVWIRLPW